MDADKHNDGEKFSMAAATLPPEDQAPPAVVVKEFVGKAGKGGAGDENNSQD